MKTYDVIPVKKKHKAFLTFHRGSSSEEQRFSGVWGAEHANTKERRREQGHQKN
jgi:hypothetical protein